MMLLAANMLHGQNLVPNPSFEEYISCPGAADEFNLAKGWSSYSYSPDYFNTCATTPTVLIPTNAFGYQYAASGKAYSGLLAYVTLTLSGIKNYREYIGERLSNNLTKGTKYYVSFKVSLGYRVEPLAPATCASNNLGVQFTNIPYNPGKPRLTNNSQINEKSIITDTTNWTRIFGSFIADSTYQYIVIGNFYDNLHTDTLIMDGSNLCKGAYYYIDDVCVSEDSLYTANYIWTGINELNHMPNISIYPNPATNYLNINCPHNIIYQKNKKETYQHSNILQNVGMLI